jgi:hypothetical protein
MDLKLGHAALIRHGDVWLSDDRIEVALRRDRFKSRSGPVCCETTFAHLLRNERPVAAEILHCSTTF